MMAMDNNEESPIGDLTHVEESFEDLAKSRFDLPDNFSNNSKLLLLVLSYLEGRPAKRTFRFQAIHTFHRSLWAGSILSIASAIIAMGMIELGWIANTQPAPSLILLGSLVSTYIFYRRKNKFEKTFLQYVFLDFYQDRKTDKSK